jgi:hypothetical protein
MTSPTDPTEAPVGSGSPSSEVGPEPVDHCIRCGAETPAGVGLCEEHNKGRIAGPSPNQMHATVFGGIVLGVIGFFFIASLAVTTTGPFASGVTDATGGPDGDVAVAFTVTNEGPDEGVADCRVTRDGVPRPDDLAFRTVALPGGETVSFERDLAQPPTRPAYDIEALTVVCT